MKKINYKDVFFLNHCLPRYDATFQEFFHDLSGNVGNTYIMNCICKILFGRALKHNEVSGVANLFDSNLESLNVDKINSEFKYVLINMQDQIKPKLSYYPHRTSEGFRQVNQFLKKIKIPILCYGLGANCPFGDLHGKDLVKQLNESQKTFLKIISDKAFMFSVRGDFTAEVMDTLRVKNYKIVGCPSFYTNDVMKLQLKIPIKKIAINSDFQFSKLSFYKGKYFDTNLKFYFSCQDEKHLLDDSKLSEYDSEFLNGIESLHCLTEPDQVVGFFNDKDFTIGGRVHGAIMSINNGIPAICCNIDARAKEMCQLFSIPSFDKILLKKGFLSDYIDVMINHHYFEAFEYNWLKLKKKHDEFLNISLHG